MTEPAHERCCGDELHKYVSNRRVATGECAIPRLLKMLPANG